MTLPFFWNAIVKIWIPKGHKRGNSLSNANNQEFSKPKEVSISSFWTQAALKGSSNESVLAIQPAQADQPDILTTEKATDDTGRGLWKSLLIWGGIVVGILSIAAVAPLCHYGSRLRPPTFTFSNVTAPPMVQRLVGEFSLPAFLIFFVFFFPQ